MMSPRFTAALKWAAFLVEVAVSAATLAVVYGFLKPVLFENPDFHFFEFNSIAALQYDVFFLAAFAIGPKCRVILKGAAKGDWQGIATTAQQWIILVDEPAEIESRTQAYSRGEFRRLADRERTKEKIVAALSK